MSKEKPTPVEWLLNELDERDMIDKTIYNKKDRTFESISEEALKMEEEYHPTIHQYEGCEHYPLSLAKEIAREMDVEKKVYSLLQSESIVDDYGKPTSEALKIANISYNQCLEDNKDKKYTEEDLRNIIRIYSHAENELSIGEIIQSIQPKTECEVEIVEGKLKRK